MRSLLRWLAVIGLAYLAAMLALALLQRRLLYHPAPPLEPRLRDATLLRTVTSDQLPVVALYLPAAPGQPTVVHFHGNAEQLADIDWLAATLRAAGLGLYAVEYPGYGIAGGPAPSEARIYAVAEAALRELHTALRIPPSQIVLHGHSLGSGVAAEMAARGHGARLVLVSPYTSMLDMAERLMPIFPVRWLVRDRYDTIGKARQLKLPVLIIHGEKDGVIPVEMGRRLAATIAGAALIVDPEGGHNDLFALPAYGACVARFARGEVCAALTR